MFSKAKIVTFVLCIDTLCASCGNVCVSHLVHILIQWNLFCDIVFLSFSFDVYKLRLCVCVYSRYDCLDYVFILFTSDCWTTLNANNLKFKRCGIDSLTSCVLCTHTPKHTIHGLPIVSSTLRMFIFFFIIIFFFIVIHFFCVFFFLLSFSNNSP